MKRLTLLVLALILTPNNIFALDPGQQHQFDLLLKRPAYPILPTNSIILGGQMLLGQTGMPVYTPNTDFSDGKVVIGFNNIGNPNENIWKIDANPSWENPYQIQEISLLCDLEKIPKFIAKPDSGYLVYQDQNCIVSVTSVPSKKEGVFVYTLKATDLDYKTIFKINIEDSKPPCLKPLTRQFFFLESKGIFSILDKAGKTVKNCSSFVMCNDTLNRFALVDGKLFEFSRMDFVPIDIYQFAGEKKYVFKSECVDILNVATANENEPNQLQAWCYSYSWNLIDQLSIDNPVQSSNIDWRLWQGDYIVYFDKSEKSKQCGWHIFNYKQAEEKLFLCCQSFASLAIKAEISNMKMLVPTPDGAWIVDFEKLCVENRYFPTSTSIVETEKGYFAIGYPSDNTDMTIGYLLDENLKPIEYSKTILPKASNYLSFEKKIISIWQTYEQYYDTIKRISQYNVSLSLSFSYVGESSPKKISHFRFKSRHKIASGLGCSVFKGILYIPTGVADFFSIDLTSFKSQSYINDEMFFKYGNELTQRPCIFVNEQMTVFLFQDKRLLVFDKWKNLKIDADTRPMGGNSTKKAWIWWDKILIAFDSYSMVYKISGTAQYLDGKPVDFYNGFYTYISKDAQGKEILVGQDIDTSYKKTLWPSMPQVPQGGNLGKIGSDYFSNGIILDSESNIIQTGINGISCQDVVSGNAFFMQSSTENQEKGCGNDHYITKWTPASTYSIRRSYINEFIITSTRGDGKTTGFSGTVYVCAWGNHGLVPTLTKLVEVTQIKNLAYGQSVKFRIKIPDNLNYENLVDETPCFGIVVIGDGLLDTAKSSLEKHDEAGRAIFDGTPINAINQMAVSVTVWTEQ